MSTTWYWTEEYDGQLLKAERVKQGLNQDQLADFAESPHPIRLPGSSATLGVRSIQKIEINVSTVSFDLVQLYAARLKKPLSHFQRKYRLPPRDVGDDELLKLCRVAVYGAHNVAQWVMAHPWEDRLRPTSSGKITGSPQDDKTDLIDQVTSDFIRNVFQQAVARPRHPLTDGAILVDEELGIVQLSDGPARFVIVVDSADDTVQFKRSLAGMILVSIYEIGVGVVAAAALDVIRRKLYCRVRGAGSQAIQISDSLDRRIEPGEEIDPPGRMTVTLRPSGQKQLSGSTLNVYTGKAYRIGLLAKTAPTLSSRNDINVVSYGGSRGPVLVADSTLDAAIELTKGFRYIDALSGLFIAAGAGATLKVEQVRSFDATDATPIGVRLQASNPLDFGPIQELDDIFLGAAGEEERRQKLERLRLAFVVSGTEDLATEILETL